MCGKLVLYALFLVSVTAVINLDRISVLDSPTAEIKDHPGKCYINELGLFDNTDFVRVGKRCEMVKCLGNEKGQYEMKRCSYVVVEPPCWAKYATEDPFPDCCEFEIKCYARIPDLLTLSAN